MARLRIEFTVEPFEAGRPGPHVRAAVAAVEATGLPVDFGPFSSVAVGEAAVATAAVAALLDAAVAAGATRVSLQVTTEGDEP